MIRAQKNIILKDLEKKLVLLVGPRQAGKTWLAKDIATSFPHSVYLNYDQIMDRKIMLEQSWLPSTDLLILDELHKMPDWKNYLKGVFDTRLNSMRILVTGSARLDIYDNIGDSLVPYFFADGLNSNLSMFLVHSYKRSIRLFLFKSIGMDSLLTFSNLKGEFCSIYYISNCFCCFLFVLSYERLASYIVATPVSPSLLTPSNS